MQDSLGESDCNAVTYPKPKDPVQIATNRKLFYCNKKAKDDKSTSKPTGAPAPKDTEPIPNAYNPSKPRWDEDNTPPIALAAATPPPAPAPAQTTTSIEIDTVTTDATGLTAAETSQSILDIVNLLRPAINNTWHHAFNSMEFFFSKLFSIPPNSSFKAPHTSFSPSSLIPSRNTKPIPNAWRPPEHHKHSTRIIFGKPHTYNPLKPGCDEDETLKCGLAAATPPAPVTTRTPTSIKFDSAATDTTSLTAAETRQSILGIVKLSPVCCTHHH